MGCIFSLCDDKQRHKADGHFPVIEICEKSDSSSDSGLKGKPDKNKDNAPLLDGKTLKAFQNLNLSSSDSEVEGEIAQIGNLLKKSPQSHVAKKENDDSDDGTFKGVKIDLSQIKTDSESDDQIDESQSD